MAVGTANTDTDRLTSNAVGEEHDSAAAAADVDAPASCGLTPETTRRRRFAAITASTALFLLVLTSSCGFCVWTLVRLRGIEARLERLERTGRSSVNYVVEPHHTVDYFTRHISLPVRTVHLCLPAM